MDMVFASAFRRGIVFDLRQNILKFFAFLSSPAPLWIKTNCNKNERIQLPDCNSNVLMTLWNRHWSLSFWIFRVYCSTNYRSESHLLCGKLLCCFHGELSLGVETQVQSFEVLDSFLGLWMLEGTPGARIHSMVYDLVVDLDPLWV